MVAQRLEFHKAPFAVLRIHAEGGPDQHRGGDGPETDADPLVQACHIHDDEHHEQGKQSTCKDEQVPALESFELRAAPDSLVDMDISPCYRKNERKMVAATIRKMQAPNQLAAVFEVSGSPDENLE